ncbi:MAG: BrnA antitoxin family protein [Acidobacteria bacterium]|nr:BrnA antitoxin family protein [Acidobacteriota bacterium]
MEFEWDTAKKQVTLRIDADVLAFFKTTGRRYQTRINEVLRSYVNAQR